MDENTDTKESTDPKEEAFHSVIPMHMAPRFSNDGISGEVRGVRMPSEGDSVLASEIKAEAVESLPETEKAALKQIDPSKKPFGAHF